MQAKILPGGTVHKLPSDLDKAIRSSSITIDAWIGLTPLARNEWICWNISVKQQKTRDSHIQRTVSELKEGKKRPCCWMGCIHRKDKNVSPSVKWVLSRHK